MTVRAGIYLRALRQNLHEAACRCPMPLPRVCDCAIMSDSPIGFRPARGAPLARGARLARSARLARGARLASPSAIRSGSSGRRRRRRM
jgi:hypothetical protein